MPSWRIPLSDIDFGPEEQAALLEVLRSRWLSMGEQTQAFEAEFAAYLGCRHAVAVANGTAALHLALLALGVGPGDAVVQPAVNFVSTANMTVAAGAEPVFADVYGLAEPTLDAASAAQAAAAARRQGLRPRALVVMHYGGYACRMDELAALARAEGLAIVEDACHGVGATYGGAKLGAIGDVGCFSFFSNKNLVTGEGGMVTVERDDLAERVRRLRSHGMTSLTWDRHKGHASTYDVVCHGYNYRIDELRAAIGRVQLGRLDGNNERRRRHVERYRRRLAPLEAAGWTLPFLGADVAGSPASQPSCHLMTAVAPDEATRGRVAEALKAAGIQTSLHYPLIPAFSGFAGRGRLVPLPHAEAFCGRVLTLPLYPTMSPADVDAVADGVLEACNVPA